MAPSFLRISSLRKAWVVDKLNQEDPSSYTKGAQASLVFYGTGVRYFAQKDTNFGTAIVRARPA